MTAGRDYLTKGVEQDDARHQRASMMSRAARTFRQAVARGRTDDALKAFCDGCDALGELTAIEK